MAASLCIYVSCVVEHCGGNGIAHDAVMSFRTSVGPLVPRVAPSMPGRLPVADRAGRFAGKPLRSVNNRNVEGRASCVVVMSTFKLTSQVSRLPMPEVLRRPISLRALQGLVTHNCYPKISRDVCELLLLTNLDIANNERLRSELLE